MTWRVGALVWAWLAAASSTLWAQNETDVLRYGWIDPLSSSRVMAMGGSYGALGADLSCMGINPAGLGMYRRGDLSMTAGFTGPPRRHNGDRDNRTPRL